MQTTLWWQCHWLFTHVCLFLIIRKDGYDIAEAELLTYGSARKHTPLLIYHQAIDTSACIFNMLLFQADIPSLFLNLLYEFN